MKHSVNGKSFDDIFEQRGKNVNAKDMVIGDYYLCQHPFYLSVIFDFLSINALDCVFSKHHIFYNGSFYNETSESGMLTIERNDCFYEATPDQINLLNSYK